MLALPLLVLAGSATAASPSTTPSFSVGVTATPSSGSLPLTVTFSATVSTGTPTSVSWLFGDGASWNGSGVAATSVAHRYVSVGAFVVTAHVTEGTSVATGTATVAVASGPIVAAISATPSGGSAPLTVLFRAVVSGGTGTYPALDWTFGDGGSSSGIAVSHTFQSSGNFVVGLAVTDSANATAFVSFSLSVAAPSASSAWSPLGPATLATAGIVGAGLTWGVYYAGRRRRAHGAASDDGEAYGSVPPGVLGPMADALPAPLAAASSSEAAASSSVGESSPSVASSPRLLPTARPTLLPSVAGPSSSSTVSTVPREPAAEPRRWSRDLVAYLGGLPTLGPDDIATVAWTQKGMSERLGTGQNQVSNVLRRLVAAGLVVEELQHVQGQPRRLKIYRLSLRGEALAREMRRNRAGASRDYLKREW